VLQLGHTSLAENHLGIEEVETLMFELNYADQEKYILEGQRRYREQMNSQYTAGYTDAEEKCKAEIAKKDAEIAEKERLIAKIDAEIAEKERLIAEKEAEIAGKEKLIAEKKAEIAEKHSKISKLQDDMLSEKDATIANKDSEIAQLRAELEKYKNRNT
jgi:chromosome segregation ATPase